MRSRADLYDWELAHVAGRSDQDLAFYAALASRTDGPVLELGCGTGRLTAPLRALGLDIDEAMLARARGRGARGLVRADMRRFAFSARFGLVIIPYNGIQLLSSDDERVKCLRCVRSHLASDGRLALEVTDFQAGTVLDRVGPELLGSAEGVTHYGALIQDRGRRVTTYHRRFVEDGRALVDHAELRCLDEAELDVLLGRAGFCVEDARPTPPRLVCVARPSP